MSETEDCSTHAVAYLRVSGKGQIDGDGFPRQIECIQQYAARIGLTIVGEYRDEAVSGTKEIADRLGLASLMDRVESNGVRIVLVETSQRIARDLMVGEVILGEFRKIGVKVIECSGGNDLTVGDDNPTGKLIRQLLGAVAEYDKTMTVLKLKAARLRAKRTKGRCEGALPYGYDPKRPIEFPTMRYIIKARENHKLSWEKISRKLNVIQYRTRFNKPWHGELCRRTYHNHIRIENAGLLLPCFRSGATAGAVGNDDQSGGEDEGTRGIA